MVFTVHNDAPVVPPDMLRLLLSNLMRNAAMYNDNASPEIEVVAESGPPRAIEMAPSTCMTPVAFVRSDLNQLGARGENVITLDNLSTGFSDRYSVHCATSGTEALLTLGDTPIDIIVSAQDLPGMSGLEALREAKKRSPEMVGILLAGNDDDDGNDAGKDGSFDEELGKHDCPWTTIRWIGAACAGRY